MRAVSALILLALLTAVVAQESTTDFNDKLNTIEPKTTVRLDPYIRKALIKALSELEESDQFTTETETPDGTTNKEILRTGDDITTDTEPTEATKEGIQFHSFVVNGQAAFANLSSNAVPNFVENKISILTTTAGNVENQVTATLPTQIPLNDIFQPRESTNLQQVRSISTSVPNSIDNSIFTKETTSSPTMTVSTTTTTTTTTPKPTHNNDGENIEDVDKRDVQVFQAPLVAAFTVHQDAQGQPKKVVPIYQQTTLARDTVMTVPSSSIPNIINQPLRQSLPIIENPNPVQTDIITQQLALQKQLEDKQRLLEEQLRFLQQQQRQQEELLRKQQFFLQQKQQQQFQQQHNFEQEQFKRQQQINEQQRQQQINEQQRQQQSQVVSSIQIQSLPKSNENQFNQQQQNFRQQNAQVSIVPSVSLDQTNAINPLNGFNVNNQQLPNREAVDFLLSLRNQQPTQFPLQENHLPQGITNFLQPNQQINNFHNLNQLRPFEEPFRQKQGNRVFRQESGVGNFGFNQNYNRFNTFNPTYTNRFFAVNRNNPFPDNELKQLLVQNGLNGRNHEDLNIVTKVLSLNHGIPLNNNVSNRLPFDSRRHVRNPQ